jgi:uncharacterized membrane protein YgdD (TMEM256/DUF423 family)
MTQYRLKSEADAQRLETSAAATTERFFAGLSTKMHTVRAGTVILGLGCMVFLGSLVWLATLQVKV